MQRDSELEELARELYDAVSTADIGFFERRLTRGPGLVVIGTAPEEWWRDRDAALDAIRAQMKSVGSGVEVTAGDLRGWRIGDVGFIADRPTIRFSGITAECRHTSVFAREDGEWRLVQHHFSIGVSNVDAFGSDGERLG